MTDLGLDDSFDLLGSQAAEQTPADVGKPAGKAKAKAAPKPKQQPAAATQPQQNGKPKAAKAAAATTTAAAAAPATNGTAAAAVTPKKTAKKSSAAAAPVVAAETEAPVQQARKTARSKSGVRVETAASVAEAAPAADEVADEGEAVAAPAVRAQRKREHDVMLAAIQDNEREEGLRRTQFEEARVTLDPAEFAELAAEYGALHAHPPRTRPVPRGKGKVDASANKAFSVATKMAAATAAPVPAVMHNDLFRVASVRHFVKDLHFRVYNQCIQILQILSAHRAIDIIGRALKLACPDSQPTKPVIVTATHIFRAYVEATRGNTGLTTENVSAMAVTKERTTAK